MPYEFIPMFFALFLFLGCWGLILVGRSIREKSRLKESEMIHRERVEAMQQGLPVPEAPEIPTTDAGASIRVSRLSIHWFRAVSLALGLLFLFTGIGMCFAFLIGEDFRDVWSIGMIPAMAGIGLLLFFALSRDLASSLGCPTSSPTSSSP